MFSYDISASKKKNLEISDIILDDSKRSEPIDNVWISKFHKWKIHSFEEAVQNHRETHHPTMYNMPTAPINALIELNMQVKSKEMFGKFIICTYMIELNNHMLSGYKKDKICRCFLTNSMSATFIRSWSKQKSTGILQDY